MRAVQLKVSIHLSGFHDRSTLYSPKQKHTVQVPALKPRSQTRQTHGPAGMEGRLLARSRTGRNDDSMHTAFRSYFWAGNF